MGSSSAGLFTLAVLLSLTWLFLKTIKNLLKDVLTHDSARAVETHGHIGANVQEYLHDAFIHKIN